MIALRLLTATIFLSTAVLVSPAAAGDKPDSAQALFDTGVEQLEQKIYDKACPNIAESYRLDPRPGTLFTLAECEAQRGRLATALARYDEYLVLYATLPADKKAKQGTRPQDARSQKALLGPELPQLTLVLPANTPLGLVLTQDGAVIGEAALRVPLAVDPGEHIVTMQAPGGALKRVTVTIEKREKKTLKLELPEVSERPTTIAPPQKPRNAPSVDGPPSSMLPSPSFTTTGPSVRRIGAFVAGGVGAAGVVVGAITGGLMLAKGNTASKNCTEVPNDPGAAECKNPDWTAAGDSAKTFGLVSSIGWSLGLAGIGTATVLFITEPSKPKAAPARGAHPPRSASRWISGGVLSAGPAGSTLGLRGVW